MESSIFFPHARRRRPCQSGGLTIHSFRRATDERRGPVRFCQNTSQTGEEDWPAASRGGDGSVQLLPGVLCCAVLCRGKREGGRGSFNVTTGQLAVRGRGSPNMCAACPPSVVVSVSLASGCVLAGVPNYHHH
jgi:hypothetical protein